MKWRLLQRRVCTEYCCAHREAILCIFFFMKIVSFIISGALEHDGEQYTVSIFDLSGKVNSIIYPIMKTFPFKVTKLLYNIL